MVPPAAWIIGSAARRDSSSLKKRTDAARSWYRAPAGRCRNVRRWSVSMPAGCDSTVWKLRSVRPAPTSSSDVSATSATIRPKRSARFMLTGLRPPSLSGSAGSSRTRCHAGSTPASSPVTMHTASVKNEDRHAEDHGLIRPRHRRQLRREHLHATTPRVTIRRRRQRGPSRAHSTRTWRINLPRAAPIAARTAISRRRPAAFASSRLVTLMHAISRMNPTAAISTTSVRSTGPVISSGNDVTCEPCPRLNCGYGFSRSLPMRSISDRACSNDTPGCSRA